MTSKKGQAIKDAVLSAGKPGRKKTKRKGTHPNTLKALAEHRQPFKPNNPETGEKDPRINRKGAPNTTAAMRALVRDIGSDLVQLEEASRNGKPKTKIVSRITRKLAAMYDSSNPADSVAILKAGWPGLLGDDENKKAPKEFTFRIVYENKRPVPQDLDEEEVMEGEELGVEELGEGAQEPDADLGGARSAGGRVGGAPFVVDDVPGARWGSDSLHTNFKNQHTSSSKEEPPQDKPGYGLRYHPEEFYCVVCQEMKQGAGQPSIEHNGWICKDHIKEHSE